MLRVIGEVQPRWIVGENVSGLLNWNGGLVLKQIETDLENKGFTMFPPAILPACGVDAPHRRDRVWLIAHSEKNIVNNEDKAGKGSYPVQEKRFDGNRRPEPSILGVDDGLPDWVDRVASIGNAIVPQVAFEIFKAIEAVK